MVRNYRIRLDWRSNAGNYRRFMAGKESMHGQFISEMLKNAIAAIILGAVAFGLHWLHGKCEETHSGEILCDALHVLFIYSLIVDVCVLAFLIGCAGFRLCKKALNDIQEQ